MKNWHFMGQSTFQIIVHGPFEDLAKESNYLNGPKFLFEPLENIFSSNDIIIQENKVWQNSFDSSSILSTQMYQFYNTNIIYRGRN